MPLLIEEKLAMQPYLSLYISAYTKPAEPKKQHRETKKNR
jgi:hypothetical protein